LKIQNTPNNYVYIEEHKNDSTKFGIASLVIGDGINKNTTIEMLPFQTKSYHLRVEIDEHNGTQYKDLITTQLISVPYAMVASQLGQNNATTGQVLKWNGSKWTPDTDLTSANPSNLGGDVTGSPINNRVEKIQNRNVATTAPTNGQVLKWNGSNWIPDTDLTSGSPSNLVGDVTGSPTNNKVEKIQNRNVATTVPSNGQVLKWLNNQWTPSNENQTSGTWTESSNYQFNTNLGSVLIGTSTYPSYNPKFLVKGNSSFLNDNNFRIFNIFSQNNNGQINVNSSSSNEYSIIGFFNNTNRPVIGIANVSSGNLSIGMMQDAQNRFTVTANIKSFIMSHPNFSDKFITYACIEGPEAAAYERGTVKMINGKAEVKFSDHFGLVINPNTMTVIVTPLSKNSKGLAVTSKSINGLVIEELNNGSGIYEIDWEVKAVRKGYEDFQVIRDKKEYSISNSFEN
jgi:hypothetical protein